MPNVLHSQGTWKLAKCSVCVRNGYDGDSVIVSIIITSPDMSNAFCYAAVNSDRLAPVD